MSDESSMKSTVSMILLAVSVFAVVGAVALSGSAAGLSLNADNGNTGNVTSGAADQAIGELQFQRG